MKKGHAGHCCPTKPPHTINPSGARASMEISCVRWQLVLGVIDATVVKMVEQLNF